MNKLWKKGVAYTITAVVVFSGIVLPEGQSQKVKAADDEYEFVWSDEFNGTALDESVWTYEYGTGNWGWGNGEVQYYRKENVSVSGGCLKIQAKKENYEGSRYTSGRIISRDKKYFQYGKMEARIKVENGNQNGVWPAYWMMGQNSSRLSGNIGWPNCGEIDIMEHANSNDYVSGTSHWNKKGINGANLQSNHMYKGGDYKFPNSVNNGINGWHTYTLIWDKRHLEWQVDGDTYYTLTFTSENAYCFRKEFFFLFNLAIGGTGTGFTNYITADDNSFQTTTMYVDYLRVYQKPEVETTTRTETTTKVEETTQAATANTESVTQAATTNTESVTQAATSKPDVETKYTNATDTHVNTTTVEDTTKSQKTTSVQKESETQKVVVSKARIKKAVRTRNNKKIIISIKKIKGITGYHIKYSTSKKFAGKQTKTISVRKNAKIIKRLKSNKKYYVKVRAYKKVEGINIYGKWSKIKVVKVKK